MSAARATAHRLRAEAYERLAQAERIEAEALDGGEAPADEPSRPRAKAAPITIEEINEARKCLRRRGLLRP